MKFSRNLQIVAAVLWIVTSLSLATWWLIFSLDQLNRITEILGDPEAKVARQHRMLIQEGTFLFFLLIAGGMGLLYYIFLERKRSTRLKRFFAAFTHDLKTSISSLRLRAESLEAKTANDPNTNKDARRLIQDTVRLELQLENSLLFSRPGAHKLFLQEVDLENIIESLKIQWPEIEFEVKGSAKVNVDRRALEIIMKNFVQNAVRHAQVNKVFVEISEDAGKVVIEFYDRGKGFEGNLELLGEQLWDSEKSEGSGIGLFLARDLALQMGGGLQFDSEPGGRGFVSKLSLGQKGGS